MQREEHWVQWKRKGCPPFSKPAREVTIACLLGKSGRVHVLTPQPVPEMAEVDVQEAKNKLDEVWETVRALVRLRDAHSLSSPSHSRMQHRALPLREFLSRPRKSWKRKMQTKVAGEIVVCVCVARLTIPTDTVDPSLLLVNSHMFKWRAYRLLSTEKYSDIEVHSARTEHQQFLIAGRGPL